MGPEPVGTRRSATKRETASYQTTIYIGLLATTSYQATLLETHKAVCCGPDTGLCRPEDIKADIVINDHEMCACSRPVGPTKQMNTYSLRGVLCKRLMHTH